MDDFKKLRQQNYYYVDKTLFIKELIDKKGEVNLFTRPRRFGRTLNLSMLRYFFEKAGNEEENKALFKGLAILKEGEKRKIYFFNGKISYNLFLLEICKAACFCYGIY